MVSDSVSIPVIAHGGAGQLEHIAGVIKDGHANAITFASMLHYDYIQKHQMKGDFKEEGNIEFFKVQELKIYWKFIGNWKFPGYGNRSQDHYHSF